MDNFNQNVFRQGHFESWNNTLGKNFTNNEDGLNKARMIEKNIETGGHYQAEVSGMYGEFTVASVFKSLPEEYHVMNNILLQKGIKYRIYEPEKYGQSPFRIVMKNGRAYEEVKQSTQLDHIIVSPYGIFIIETKNHKGMIFGDMQSKVWTQVLCGENGWRAYGGRSHFTFLNPVLQNQTHIKTLAQQLKCPLNNIAGLIVFTNPESDLSNVACNCCFKIDTLYDAIVSFTNILWSPSNTIKVIKAIESIDTTSYTASKEHETYVKDMNRRHELNRIRALGKL